MLKISVNFQQVHVFKQRFLVVALPPKHLLFLWQTNIPANFASFEVKSNALVFTSIHLQDVLHYNYSHRVKYIRFYLVQTVDPGE